MIDDNPFYHRGAIRRAEEFHGRAAEVNQILGLLRNGQSVSLIGPRRIGKTSLMLHLCRPSARTQYQLAPSQALFVLIDCQELGGSPAEEVYEALLAGILDAAKGSGIIIGTKRQEATYRALDRALNFVCQSGVSVVVLLDEFEMLAANSRLTPYFFARLRGLTTKYGLAYMTASQRPLFAITADEQILSSPFFNIFVTLSLGLFSEEESLQLIQNRLEGTAIAFSSELCRQLLRLVGTHPLFLHIAGYHAFQALASGQLITDEAGLDDLMASIEIEADSHLGYLWHNLSAEEQYCLATIDGPVEILRQLEQQCLIQTVGNERVYTSEILRRYVRRQRVDGVVQAGPFVIDQQRHQVQAEGHELNLTASQFDLLVRLSQHAGRVVLGEELETAVWGQALVDDPDRLKTLIRRLRRAIEPYGSWIVSERGVGYALRPPD